MSVAVFGSGCSSSCEYHYHIRVKPHMRLKLRVTGTFKSNTSNAIKEYSIIVEFADNRMARAIYRGRYNHIDKYMSFLLSGCKDYDWKLIGRLSSNKTNANEKPDIYAHRGGFTILNRVLLVV